MRVWRRFEVRNFGQGGTIVGIAVKAPPAIGL